MAWLKEWTSLLASGDFKEAVLAACGFGSIHQKEFRFLLYGVLAEDVEHRCTRDHVHVRIQGKYTKDSAIYPPAMGMHLAVAFKNALRRFSNVCEPSWSVAGL